MIERSQTWELVEPTADKEVIIVKWVYKTNINYDGSFQKHRLRYVMKGYTQKLGMDYH